MSKKFSPSATWVVLNEEGAPAWDGKLDRTKKFASEMAAMKEAREIAHNFPGCNILVYRSVADVRVRVADKAEVTTI